MSIQNAHALLLRIQQEATQALAELAPPPSSIAVKPGDNLLSLMEQAAAGAILSIDPLFVLEADVTIAKPVALASSVDPGPSRVTSGLVGPILRGACTVNAPAVILVGLRLEGKVKESTVLTTGPGTVLDRCVVLGSPAGQHRGICANSAGVRISRSYVGNIWADIDTQAIAGWTGTKDLLVDDCYLEASGETIIFGGSDTASADLNPQDIAISNCTITKNPAWKGQAGVTVKNLVELKNAQRVTIKKCVCTYAWLSGQEGYGLVLTVRNQDGTAPWSTISDVLIEDCAFSHLGAGINVLGTDDTHPSGRMVNVVLRRLTFDDIDPGAWGGSGRQLMIGGGPSAFSLIDSTFAGKHLNSAITFAGSRESDTCDGLSITGSTFQEGDYGILGDAAPSLGKAALDLYAPGYMWDKNTIVKGSSGRNIVYPPGTMIV